MKCGIVNCAQNDNRFLWRCYGNCKRRYHAACIGVQRNNEELLRTFMLPLCEDCQEKFTPELNIKELSSSLTSLIHNMEHSLAANHKLLSNFESLSATHDETLDNVEKMLSEIKQSISIVASSNKNSAAEIKNKLSALLDTPPADISMDVEKAVKSAALAAAESITTTTTATAQSIELLPQLLAELKDDLADAHANLASDVKSHMEELATTFSQKDNLLTTNNLAEDSHENLKPKSGWRFLGNKYVWKHDWTQYDIKQISRHHQEKLAEKARSRRKQRKRKYNNECNNNNNINQNNYDRQINSNVRHTPLPLDKELLAAARIQFSRPPSVNIGPKFINFEKGETLNPYPTKKSAPNVTTTTTTTSTPEILPAGHPPLIDPMRPPIVRLTEQSAAGDQRFLKARLRDPKIMDTVRTYLSFLHDQPATVCIRGITKTSATLSLAAEGLPTDIHALNEIFLDVHEELGIPRKDALADLHSHRQFLTSERTHRLQQLRESTNKFHTPSPGQTFRK